MGRILTALGWLAAVAAATSVGLVTVSLLSGGITDNPAGSLSNKAVARALASASVAPNTGGGDEGGRSRPRSAASTGPATWSPNTSPGSSANTSPQSPDAPAPVTRSLSSAGGTVIARCQGASTYLVSWSPAQGWETDSVARGPAATALVEFDGESGPSTGREVALTISCRDGEPVATEVSGVASGDERDGG